MFGIGRSKEVEETLQGFLSLQTRETQRQYAGIMREWTGVLGSTPFHKATEIHAMKWAKNASAKPGIRGQVSKSTLRRKAVILKELYAVLQDHRLVDRNPFRIVAEQYEGAQVGDRRATNIVPFKEVERFLTSPSADSPDGVTDRAFFALLFGCGLRVGEASKLNLEDVIIGGPTGLYLILRSTKNGSDAEQMVPEEMVQYVVKLVTQRSGEGAKPGDPLIVLHRVDRSPVNKTVATRQLHRIFQRWCRILKLTGRYSPHSARATAITYLLEQGVSHRVVRVFSRHSSVTMVEKYDKLRDTGLEEAINLMQYKKRA